jgi:hypothetical protein
VTELEFTAAFILMARFHFIPLTDLVVELDK